MKVEVDCFSGQPNPTFELMSEEEIYVNVGGAFIDIVDKRERDGLGYRCMILDGKFVKLDSHLEKLLKQFAEKRGIFFTETYSTKGVCVTSDKLPPDLCSGVKAFYTKWKGK